MLYPSIMNFTISFKRKIMVVLVTLPLIGCAYFNTYYNAKRLYDSATRNRRDFPDTVTATGGDRTALQQAADKFAKVAARYPGSRWATPSIFYIGNAYSYLGESDKAIRKYTEIWQQYPESKYAPLARLNAMVLNYKISNYHAALAEFDILKNWPHTDIRAKANFLEGEIVQAQKDFSSAAIIWQRFLFNYPHNPYSAQARYKYALCLAELGETAKATSELEPLLKKRLPLAFFYDVCLLAARCYTDLQQDEKALKIYRKLLKKKLQPGQSALVQLLVAQLLANKSSPSQAAGIYADLASQYPQSLAANVCYLKMAEIMENSQELDSAQALYKKACQDKKDDLGYAAFSGIKVLALKHLENLNRLTSYRKELSPESGEQNAKLEFLIAEHYLFNLNQPDSAYAIYLQVAASYPATAIAPKALYAAAWTLSRNEPDTAVLKSSWRNLIAQYPNTRYANAARLQLGLDPDTTVRDTEPVIEFKVKPAEPSPAVQPGQGKKQASPAGSDSASPIPGPTYFDDRPRRAD